jgi:hypothetical protein
MLLTKLRTNKMASVEKDIIEKLEESKKAVLKRIADDLKEVNSSDIASTSHQSHSSGTGKGHTSYVSVTS